MCFFRANAPLMVKYNFVFAFFYGIYTECCTLVVIRLIFDGDLWCVCEILIVLKHLDKLMLLMSIFVSIDLYCVNVFV